MLQNALTVLPEVLNPLSLVAILLATFLAMGLGLWVTGRKLPLEVSCFIGWGLLVLALSLWGMLTSWPLYMPVIALAGLGIAGFLHSSVRPAREDFFPLGRAVVTGIPILLVTAGVEIWASDSFSAWVPNLLFLADHHRLPSHEGYSHFSAFPALPYGFQLIAYPATLLGAREFALVHMALVMLVLTSSLFARFALCLREFPSFAPQTNYRAHVLGWVLVMALNPAFVPALAFSSYADAPSQYVLWLVFVMSFYRAPSAEIRRVCERSVALLLILLVTLKQQNGVYPMLWAAVYVLVHGWLYREAFFSSVLRAAFMAAPALLLWAGWDVYVRLEEMRAFTHAVKPEEAWRLSQMPMIALWMLKVLAKKGYYFGACILVTGFGVRALWKRYADSHNVWLAAGALLFLGYNAFLYVVYVTYITGGEVISYWRYNTHLGLVMMTALLPWAAAAWQRISASRAWQLERIAILVWCILPVALSLQSPGRLRNDLRPPAIDIRALAAEIGAALPKQGETVHMAYYYDKQRRPEFFKMIRGFTWLAHIENRFPIIQPENLNAKAIAPGEYLVVICKPDALPIRMNQKVEKANTILLKREARGRAEFTVVGQWPTPANMGCL